MRPTISFVVLADNVYHKNHRCPCSTFLMTEFLSLTTVVGRTLAKDNLPSPYRGSNEDWYYCYICVARWIMFIVNVAVTATIL